MKLERSVDLLLISVAEQFRTNQPLDRIQLRGSLAEIAEMAQGLQIHDPDVLVGGLALKCLRQELPRMILERSMEMLSISVARQIRNIEPQDQIQLDVHLRQLDVHLRKIAELAHELQVYEPDVKAGELALQCLRQDLVRVILDDDAERFTRAFDTMIDKNENAAILSEAFDDMVRADAASGELAEKRAAPFNGQFKARVGHDRFGRGNATTFDGFKSGCREVLSQTAVQISRQFAVDISDQLCDRLTNILSTTEFATDAKMVA